MPPSMALPSWRMSSAFHRAPFASMKTRVCSSPGASTAVIHDCYYSDGRPVRMAPREVLKHVLDLYGDKGEGEVKQLEFIIGRLDDAMAMLEARRDSIALTLVEMKLIRAAFAKELKSKPRA